MRGAAPRERTRGHDDDDEDGEIRRPTAPKRRAVRAVHRWLREGARELCACVSMNAIGVACRMTKIKGVERGCVRVLDYRQLKMLPLLSPLPLVVAHAAIGRLEAKVGQHRAQRLGELIGLARERRQGLARHDSLDEQ